MTTLETASKIAHEAHSGQVRKFSSLPYITHPLAVAATVLSDEAKMVAILHDVLEDTPVTEEELRGEGIPEDVIFTVVTLTEVEGELYRDYIERVSKNPLARTVKIADLKHNMSDLPLGNTLRHRYEKALEDLGDK